jgi:hypothetical protein
MATTFIGLSSAAKGRERLYAYKCNTAGLLEGAVFMFDGSVNGQLVKAPTGAAVAGVAGVLADVVNATTGTVVGTDINLQKDGVANVLLKAGEAVVAGDALVVAGTDGSVRKLNTGTDDGADIVGYSEVARTAGATNELIPARVEITRFKA